jgi:hypothetical protein
MSVAARTRTFHFEIFERASALRLRLVGVHRRGVDALALQVANNAIGSVLGRVNTNTESSASSRSRRQGALFRRAVPGTRRASPYLPAVSGDRPVPPACASICERPDLRAWSR